MELRALREHGSSLSGLLALNEGRLLSWAQSSSTLRVWNAAGDLLRDLESETEVRGALKLRDGRLLSWSEDRKIRLWSADGDLLRITEKHHGYISRVLELQDGRLLSWAQDHKPRLWTSDGEPIRLLKAHGGQVRGILELRDGRLFSWASHTYKRLWSSNGDLIRVLKCWPDDFFLRLRDDRFACWLDAGELHILNVDDAVLLRSTIRFAPMTCGAIELKNGRLLSWARDLIMNTFRDGASLNRHEQDNTLRLWSADGTLLQQLVGHTNHVHGARELKDGRLLSWSEDGTLRLWSADGMLLNTLDGHASSVNGVLRLSNDRFISWSQDSMLRLWDFQGELLATFEGEARIFHCVALQDGQTIVAGNTQGHLMFIQLANDDS